MKIINLFTYLPIVLLLSIFSFGGCKSTELVNCQQERLEQQKIIKAQETELNNLKYGNETVIKLLLETTTKLKDCERQLQECEVQATSKNKESGPEQTTIDIRKGLEELKALKEAKIKKMNERKDKEQKTCN